MVLSLGDAYYRRVSITTYIWYDNPVVYIHRIVPINLRRYHYSPSVYTHRAVPINFRRVKLMSELNEENSCGVYLKCFQCDSIFEGRLRRGVPTHQRRLYSYYVDPKVCPHCGVENGGDSSDSRVFKVSVDHRRLDYDHLILINAV